MNIICQKKLSSTQFLDVLSLKQANNTHYKSRYDAYADTEENDYDAFFLMYDETDNKKLISYLAVFAPFDDGVEITGYTHPDFLNKGCFSSLLNYALGGINVPVYFSICQSSKEAASLLKKLGASVSHSEYIMTLNSKINVPVDTDAAFCEVEVEKDREYLFYIEKEAETLGEARIVIDGNLLNICDVLIYENFRYMGYGYDLMMHVIDHIQCHCDSSLKIILQVSSSNVPACNLYKKIGFEVCEETKYYRMQQRKL